MANYRFSGVLSPLTCALALVSCAGEEPREAPAPAEFTVVATDFAFSAPPEVPAGAVTFQMVNQGTVLHHAGIVRLDEGVSIEQYMDTLRAGSEGTAFTRYYGGPNVAVPGDTANATVMLEPGRYFWVCFVEDPDPETHLFKGMFQEFQVVASDEGQAAMPAADVTVTMRDYEFDLSGPVASGTRIMRFVNEGPQIHDVELVALAPGKTMDDFLGWMGGGMQGEPPGRLIGGSVGIDPGRGVVVTARFEPGEYGLVCLVPDAGDRRPHFMHGMVTQFGVS